MKTHYVRFFLAVFIVSSISSCEQGYSYNYILTNKTDTIITIYIKTFSKDTTFNFMPNETKSIFSTFHGMEGNGGPFLSEVNLIWIA